jgi:hypothetical protein
VTDEEKRKEGKTIIEEVAKLKYEIQHNRQITWVAIDLQSPRGLELSLTDVDSHCDRPLPDDGQPDIAEYNGELEQRGNGDFRWHDGPWLFAECYLCRCNRVYELLRRRTRC